jgi:hypothetical protein
MNSDFRSLVDKLNSGTTERFQFKLNNIIEQLDEINKIDFTYFLEKLNSLYKKNKKKYSYDENIINNINFHAKKHETRSLTQQEIDNLYKPIDDIHYSAHGKRPRTNSLEDLSLNDGLEVDPNIFNGGSKRRGGRRRTKRRRGTKRRKSRMKNRKYPTIV